MGYTNSPLVVYTKLSPNHSGKRTHAIDRISPHCVVGQLTAESLGNIFAKSSREASSNYGIDKDGRVGMYVEEKNRSWCTSSNSNDQRAVTIECASDTKHPYWMNDKVYNRLIDLCADICHRNGKNKLIWFGDKNKSLNYEPKSNEMVITVHRWFANKSCVPTNSEVLTKEGWVRIGDIKIGDEIACADIDNLRITFEEVYDKVPVKQQDTYTNNGLTATKDHRMVYCTHASDFWRIEDYKHLLSSGNLIYIPLAGYAKNDGLNITDDMLRFYIAVQADGHYMYEKRKNGEKSYHGLEFHLKKERKIERIKEILDSCGFDWVENKKSDGSVSIRIYNDSDVNIVRDICEKFLENKHFTWKCLELSEHQAKVFLEEILLWDGCINADMYTSKDKINIDIVSALASINGVGSKVTGDNITFRDVPYMTLGKDDASTKRNSKQHGTAKTEVTCVSVKTGIFLMRQNGKTFIVGNCPGDWLYNRLGDVAKEVNKRLSDNDAKADSNTKAELNGETIDEAIANGNVEAKPALHGETNSIGEVESSPSIRTLENDEIIWNFFKAKGLNDYAIAGLMGNLKAESNLRPDNLQNSFEGRLGSDSAYVKKVDNGTYSKSKFANDHAGFGLAQWTWYTRKEALYDYAKKRGTSISDLNMQLEYLWIELQRYTKTMSVLRNAKSIYEASTIVLTDFEKPANQGNAVRNKRAEFGKELYNKFAKANVGTIEPSLTQRYRVQCGAFGVKANADKLANRLKKAGYAVTVKQIDALYKVAIYGIKSKEEANALASKIVRSKLSKATVLEDN